MENNTKKSIAILRDDFISSLSNLINSSGVPLIILEPIMKDVYEQIVSLNNKQLALDREAYEKTKENESDDIK